MIDSIRYTIENPPLYETVFGQEIPVIIAGQKIFKYTALIEFLKTKYHLTLLDSGTWTGDMIMNERMNALTNFEKLENIFDIKAKFANTYINIEKTESSHEKLLSDFEHEDKYSTNHEVVKNILENEKVKQKQMIFGDTGNIVHSSFIKPYIPTSHYFVRIFITPHNQIIFEYSIPKLIYSSNTVQLLPLSIYQNRNYYHLENKKQLVESVRLIMLKAIKILHQKLCSVYEIDFNDLYLNRIDFCYNAYFKPSFDIHEYLLGQKKIKLKGSQSWSDFNTYETGIWKDTKGYTFKIYEKISDYLKHEKEFHKKAPLKYEMFKKLAQRLLRFEVGYKPYTITNIIIKMMLGTDNENNIANDIGISNKSCDDNISFYKRQYDLYHNYLIRIEKYQLLYANDIQKYRDFKAKHEFRDIEAEKARLDYEYYKKNYADKTFCLKLTPFKDAKQENLGTYYIDKDIFYALYLDFESKTKQFELKSLKPLHLTTIESKVIAYNKKCDSFNKLLPKDSKRRMKKLYVNKMKMFATLFKDFDSFDESKGRIMSKNTYTNIKKAFEKIDINLKQTQIKILPDVEIMNYRQSLESIELFHPDLYKFYIKRHNKFFANIK